MLDNTIFDFLSELKENNNKEFFDTKKNIYQKAKKQFEAFVGQLILEISSFDDSVGELRANDLIFRINRDIRFSKDKSPYKTNFGAFVARGGKKSGNAGYYLHLEPGGSFVAGGLYCPPADILKAVRSKIYYESADYKKIIENTDFVSAFGKVEGQKLKTAPKGFDKNFEDIDLLKFKDYIVSHSIADGSITNRGFLFEIVEIFEKMKDFNSFFNEAIDESGS